MELQKAGIELSAGSFPVTIEWHLLPSGTPQQFTSSDQQKLETTLDRLYRQLAAGTIANLKVKVHVQHH